MNPFLRKKKFFLIVFFLIAVFFIERWCHEKTEGFRISNLFLKEKIPPHLFAAKELDDLQTKALKQPYFFLASGGECYVFESEDKQWVLKFFKNHHLTSLSWMDAIPLPHFLDKKREDFLKKRRLSTHHFWNSCHLTHEKLQEETALAFLQTTPHLEGSYPLEIYDKIGVRHTLHLEKIPFALQRKVELFLPSLEQDIKNHRLKEAQSKITAAIQAASKLLDKGIKNSDPEIKRNLGWEGSQVIFIDLGSFEKSEESFQDPSRKQKELGRLTRRLHQWLLDNHPDLWSFYQKTLEKEASL